MIATCTTDLVLSPLAPSLPHDRSRPLAVRPTAFLASGRAPLSSRRAGVFDLFSIGIG